MSRLANLAAALAMGSMLAGHGRAGPAATDRWSGAYIYGAGFGRNAGGDGMAVEYRLDLSPAACRLRASGYQTDETLACTTTAAGDRLEVRFKSYGDGKLANAYGVAEYKPGQPLLALERHGAALLTRWEGYQLLDGKPRAPAVAFVRRR